MYSFVLLFVIFFNDFLKYIKKSQVIQYADDTVILFAHQNMETISTVLNEDLENISMYSHQNELLFNLKKGKTELILLGVAQQFSKVN